jgi:hypothetical protein
MNTSTASRALVVARTGLTIAAFTLISCAADDLTSAQKGASLPMPMPTMSAASADEQHCAGHASTHTLFLEDADGNAFQLVYVGGCGWKYVAGGKSADSDNNLAFRKMEFSWVATAQAETMATSSEDPLAVFVDGPTGYTFIWTAGTGWKFVGHITE